MTFSESINTCLREKYAKFEGRASRSEYWWFTLMLWIGYAFFGFMAVYSMGIDQFGNFGEPGAIGWVFIVCGVIFVLGTFIPTISVSVRRFHDRNLSGWWYLGVIVLSNVPFVGFAVSIGALVIMALKGTEGPNNFGADPLATSNAEIFS